MNPEQARLTKQSIRSLFRLYLVTDPGMRWSKDLVESVRMAINGGVTAVQYRNKNASTSQAIEEASRLLEICRSEGVPLLVNDLVEVAVELRCDGVHLGQSDRTVAIARELLGEDVIIGLTITSPAELLRAHDGVDYFGVSSVFATLTKPDAPDPVGLTGIAALRELTSRPLIAIGGVGAANAASCIRAGADGVAVVSAIMDSANPEQSSRKLLREVESALGERSG